MPLLASALPPVLLDLTLFSLCARSHRFACGSTARYVRALPVMTTMRSMHQAALVTSPPPSPYEYPDRTNSLRPQVLSGGRRRNGGSLTVRSGKQVATPASELERRVQALKETVVSEESALTPPSYSEEELLSIYEDLLALPSTNSNDNSDPTTARLARAQEDVSIVNAVDQRLFGSQPAPLDKNHISPLLSTLQERRARTPDLAEDGMEANEASHTETPSAQPYLRVLRQFEQVVGRMEAVRALSPSTDSSTPSVAAIQQDYFPISILSTKECECLTRVCIQARNGEAAELALDLLRRTGVTPSEDSITGVLELYAVSGEVMKAERFLSNFVTGPPTERQRHLHIKSHLKATPPHDIPTSSLAVLHSYEAQSHPAPMTTYTLLITTLFSLPSSVARAQAWDLFTHMRYVAHPNPDALLYTLMIRACASPLSSSRSSEPERALDLWTEMTIDHKIIPTVGSYNAIILACARSGSKMYVNEAFRLAKEMLNSHRDASGRSAFRPDGRTFCALLEGAKRLGDLARVRWILAEMVRGSGNEQDGGMIDVEVTEEVMMHVFHAYAAYQPPFQRTDTLLRSEDPGESTTPSEIERAESVEGPPVMETQPTFTHIPPQSRSEVIAEAKALFNRILTDTGTEAEESNLDTVTSWNKKFKNVQLSSRLLNSYLSVYYKHSSLEVSQALFEQLFEDLGVSRNARSYVEVLERCGSSRRGRERILALKFAEEVWTKWQVLENTSRENEDGGRGFSARMIERAHVAMIRVLTLTDNVNRAINHIKAFVARYPAADIRAPTPKPALRATRTVLVGARPLVRMTSTVEVPDDSVPPLLTFRDLEVLHHRLVATGKRDEIGLVKYVCKAYEGALRARRDGSMKAEPAKTDPITIAV